MSEDRTIEEVKRDLIEALEDLRDQEAEVCHAEMNRDTVACEVDGYKKELDQLGLARREIEDIQFI